MLRPDIKRRHARLQNAAQMSIQFNLVEAEILARLMRKVELHPYPTSDTSTHGTGVRPSEGGALS